MDFWTQHHAPMYNLINSTKTALHQIIMLIMYVALQQAQQKSNIELHTGYNTAFHYTVQPFMIFLFL